MPSTPLLGAFSVSRSRDISDCRSVNLYPEFVENKLAGKTPGALYMTPGLDLKTTIGAGPIRGLGTLMNADGSSALYAVSNNTLVKMDTSFNQTAVGTGGNTTGPVSFVSNATQIAYFDGTNGFSWDNTTFATISLPFVNPGVATEQDGFVLVNQKFTNKVWQSNLSDLTTWNALNFTSLDARPENGKAVFELKRNVYCFKDTTTEIYSNQGLPGFAFQRDQGAFIEQGLAAPFSAAKGGDTLFWLSQNASGQGMVFSTSTLAPTRISTHALEFHFGQFSTISDAIGFSYQAEGHVFYQLTFPTAGETWVYDQTSSNLSGQPQWHQRAAFSNGVFSRHQSNCYAFFNGQHIVGDFASGKIYALNMDTLTDAGAQRKWLRTWRALEKPVYRPFRFDNLFVDMTTGIATPPSANPLVTLRWSDDGGYNWSPEQYGAQGSLGQTPKRVFFTRLGSTKADQGLDRIFELSSSDQFQVALMAAEINY